MVGGFYIPPHSASIIYKIHIESIHIVNQYPGFSFVFCCDYNVPEISWDVDCLTYHPWICTQLKVKEIQCPVNNIIEEQHGFRPGPFHLNMQSPV